MLFAISNTVFAQAPYLFSIKAKKNDGVISVLKRYHLYDHPCNVDQFYTLNNLKPNSNLVLGKSYKIPVYIYKYNGSSIRSTIKINNWDIAKRIQSYNAYLLKNNLRKTDYRQSNILWVPYNEIHCKSSITSESTPNSTSTTSNTKIISEPLFGSKYKSFKQKDSILKGKVYYLISGHGGPDPGAMYTEGHTADLCEDEYAYDVVLRMAKNLMAHGATVHIIIQDKNDGIRDQEILKADKDEVCYPKKRIPLNQLDRLKQRSDAVNQLYIKHKKQGVKEQLAIVVHVDSRGKNTEQDVFFYHHKFSSKGKLYAEKMRDTFKRKYNKYQKKQRI